MPTHHPALRFIIKKFAAKGKIYENCRMLAMTGDLLCHCDRRKLEWWVRFSMEPSPHTPQASGLLATCCPPLAPQPLLLLLRCLPHRYVSKGLAERVSNDPPTIRCSAARSSWKAGACPCHPGAHVPPQHCSCLASASCFLALLPAPALPCMLFLPQATQACFKTAIAA